MNQKAPRVVRKIKLGGKWIFAAVAKKGDRLDFTHVVVKGKNIPASEGSFHLDFFEAGRRRRPCVGTDAAAVRRALGTQQHVLELRRRGMAADDAPEIQRRVEGKPLAEIVAEFEISPPAGISKKSAHKYLAILREFATWSAAAQLTHAPMIDDRVLAQYIRHMRDREALEPSTIRNKIAQICAELKLHGCTFALRAKDLPKIIHKERDIYAPETLRAIFAACRPNEYILFQTFLLTGMREQEVAFLQHTDIDARRSVIRVTSKPQLGFTPKTYHERSVSVPRRLITALQDHLGKRTGLVFPTSDIWAEVNSGRDGGKRDKNLRLKLKRVAHRAGLNCGNCVAVFHRQRVTCATHPVCAKFFLHKFRHTYATSMLRDKMDIETLRKQLGHADINSTLIYLHALGPEGLTDQVEASSLAQIF